MKENNINSTVRFVRVLQRISYDYFYSVFVSLSCPKALYQLENDNPFHITLVVADWLA